MSRNNLAVIFEAKIMDLNQSKEILHHNESLDKVMNSCHHKGQIIHAVQTCILNFKHSAQGSNLR